LFVGLISVLVASLGIVDFLSYICSAGYLYVLFNASLAMITLHKKFPDIRRPYKVAFFPLTAYIAAGSCIFILLFTDWKALVFGAGVLVVGVIYYYSYRPLGKIIANSQKAASLRANRILVPIANPQSASRLIRMASILAKAVEDTSIHALAVAPQRMRFLGEAGNRLTTWLDPERQRYLDKIANESIQNGEDLFSELVSAPSVTQGILETLEKQPNVKLILAGWPGALQAKELSENPVNKILLKARTNVAVLLDRGIENISNILVPVGGGVHSRLAIQLAHQIAHQCSAQVTALRIFEASGDSEDLEDQELLLEEIIEEELEELPVNFNLKVVESARLIEGIMQEIAQEKYDLLIIGASEEWAIQTRLFGSVDDWIAEKVACSVLMVRRFEPVAMAWIKLQVKRLSDNHTT
jgi:nucleotide-binding universal stress UspA family protein